MKNLVTLLFVISALLGSVFSYKCMSGMSRNSTTCNESVTECLGDQCMTISQYTKIDGNEFNSIFKGCANETMCGANGSAAGGSLRYQISVNSCIGEICNTDGFQRAEDPTPNGVTCPSAFCKGSMKECKTYEEKNCTGSMDRCYEFIADASDPGGREIKVSVKGCINTDACKYDFDCAIGVSISQRKYLKC